MYFDLLEDTPVDRLLLVANEDGVLSTIEFSKPGCTSKADLLARGRRLFGKRDTQCLAPVAEQLREYFSGTRREFDLPLAPEGTAFQQSVWDQLRQVPWGMTRSYGEVARRIGNPKAVRAVGLANGRNPISIIIPCHRIIGSNGKLTGFGGGLARKVNLLRLEGVALPFDEPAATT